MNTTSDLAVNISSTLSFTKSPLLFNLSSLPTSLSSSPMPSEPHNPLLTIMVVLGLSLLLAVCAIFLALCCGSSAQTEEDSVGGCSSGESLVCGPYLSSEPQLKLWKRLGSVQWSFTSSFRRPPQRRPECSTHCSPTRQQPDHSSSPTLPCPACLTMLQRYDYALTAR
ncbi:uncharacterized protein C10orf105-like [Oncorhynchus keta]|uniref:uncharacterized protein C10orf105-like n=1 Tax=Oncorhynchus keta TaxID=8018 RepID=UPI00227CDB99|nr:uncharacterized protein C10orf105-like [Oncorhynchus keta]